MTDRIAALEDVGKRFVKYEDVPTLLMGMRRLLRRGKRSRLWAVRHIDLEVSRGDAVGFIGRNGSGKSTTLSMLAGVTAPTEGIVRVQGRLAPLLKLGVGFQNELTGRENVFINGMILGMTAKEVERRFDDIVAFAEMERFIDTPVKFYSSGMLVRLGFSSALAADPDLLLIDEVLSVGDVAFQMRCFDRMTELRQQGTTLIVVSHNLGAIRRLADRVMVLHDGTARFQGPTTEGIGIYHDLLSLSVVEAETSVVPGGSAVEVLSFELHDASGLLSSHFHGGEEVEFRFRLRFNENVEHASFGLSIATESGQFVYGESSSTHGMVSFEAGREVTLRVRAELPLTTGTYSAIAGFTWGKPDKQHLRSPTKVFYLAGRRAVRGFADLHGTFSIDEAVIGSDIGVRDAADAADAVDAADAADATDPAHM